MKKSVRILLIVIIVIVAILAFAVVAVSPVAKWYVQKHDTELIGRELTIDKLHVNVLTGRARITNLTLFEDDAKTPFLQFKEFDTRIRILPMLKNTFNVRHLKLTGLKVNVEQQGDKFNFTSLIDHFKPTQPAKPKSGKKPSIILNDISLDKSSIRYADLLLGSSFLLRDISVTIPHIDLSSLDSDMGLDVNLAEGGSLHSQLKLADNATDYTLHLVLDKFGLPVIEPYLAQSLAVDSLQGLLNFDITAQGSTQHLLDCDVSGNISLNDLSVNDLNGSSLVSLGSVAAVVNRFNPEERVIDLQSLALSGLQSAFILDSLGKNNFSSLVLHVADTVADSTFFDVPASDTAMANVKVDTISKPFDVRIGSLSVSDAALVYEDNTLPEPFRYEISDLVISSDNVSLQGSNSAHLQASLNKLAKLDVVWKGSISDLQNQDLTLVLTNLKISDFSPYFVKLFGCPFENGTLSFNSQNIIANGDLQGINKLEISSPKVGKKLEGVDPQYGKIPLKLGLYLLTDKNDNLAIDLPVSGNINDPEFSYRKAILKVFNNLLVKVVSSPFRLLSSDDGIPVIPFDPMQPDFSASEYTLLDDVAASLISRSDISVNFVPKVNYQETVKRLCDLQLKRDYYLSQHPSMDTANLNMLTNEAINSINIKDKELCEFAKQYSEKKKLKHKSDVEDVALALYKDSSETILLDILKHRKSILMNYLTSVKGVKSAAVSCSSATIEEMKSYEKKTCYELNMVVDENAVATGDAK